jgi:hypothetical protein
MELVDKQIVLRKISDLETYYSGAPSCPTYKTADVFC